MNRIKVMLILLAVAVIAVSGLSYAQTKGGESYSKAEVSLRLAMRKLWEEHVVYTRYYIISALAGLQDIDVVTQNLLKNQDNIGDSIKPYYGTQAGDKLGTLLREHISIATEVIKASKEGDDKELDSANKRWYVNADNIATLLSSVNPFWTKQDLTGILHKHLELTTGEVTSRLKKYWPADIDYYNKGYLHMLMFADAVTEGIVKQFPNKFRK